MSTRPLRELGTLSRLGTEPQADPQPEDPGLRGLVDYWRSKCRDGRLPARADLDPMEMRDWLPHVLLCDVQRAPRRFRWRLQGTHLTEAVGRDGSGQWFDELYDGAVLAQFLRIYNQVVDSANIVRTAGPIEFPGKRPVITEAVNMPLAGDGANVDMILTGLVMGAGGAR